MKAETNGALSENVDEKKTAKPVQTSNVTAKPFTLASPMAKPTVAKVSAPVVKSGSGVEKLQVRDLTYCSNSIELKFCCKSWLLLCL